MGINKGFVSGTKVDWGSGHWDSVNNCVKTVVVVAVILPRPGLENMSRHPMHFVTSSSLCDHCLEALQTEWLARDNSNVLDLSRWGGLIVIL